MQELLGRIARLDPSASLGLRVIACFDELMVGHVNTRALLAAAASLAGCPAGFRSGRPPRTLRVDPRGDVLPADGPAPPSAPPLVAVGSDGLEVWLERSGPPQANDAIILERLSLAVRLRHGRSPDDVDHRRDLGRAIDSEVPAQARYEAVAALGLNATEALRVVAAPLFAVWESHPDAPEDVVPSRFGPLHVLVVPAAVTTVSASPCGVGVATAPGDLPHSFRTAVVALRLAEPPRVPTTLADDWGGLVGLLAEAPADAPQPDAERIDAVAAHPWGRSTLEAVVATQSVRQAARVAGVHHSTMQHRLEMVTDLMGFDPYDGFGRTRLGTAYLVWRLRSSRVLDMPPPAARR